MNKHQPTKREQNVSLGCAVEHDLGDPDVNEQRG
jgi:hypothetical protein